jgi:hypothetical protein
MGDTLLGIHVTAGAVGLLSGPLSWPALVRGQQVVTLKVFQCAVATVAATACTLAARDWDHLWWLAIIAAIVEAMALAGHVLSRRPAPRARAWRVRLVCGTYVGLVTALLVVSWDSPLAWIVPTAIGVPLVERTALRAARS